MLEKHISQQTGVSDSSKDKFRGQLNSGIKEIYQAVKNKVKVESER